MRPLVTKYEGGYEGYLLELDNLENDAKDGAVSISVVENPADVMSD